MPVQRRAVEIWAAISGALALSSVPYEMTSAGVKKAMVVTDAGVKGAGLISLVENAFDGSGCEIGCIYDETPPDSAHTTVNTVADLHRLVEEGTDMALEMGIQEITTERIAKAARDQVVLSAREVVKRVPARASTKWSRQRLWSRGPVIRSS